MSSVEPSTRSGQVCPYIVSELLDGTTLRTAIGSAAGSGVVVRKAIDYAIQIARGLAAAHEKRITHRDLKPDNVFVTTAGHVKILDFGLAKLTEAAPAMPGLSQMQTVTPGSEPGMILGTIGALFTARLATGSNIISAGYNSSAQYAITPDGRFLMNVSADDAAMSPITIVLNWAAGLKQ